MIRHTGKCDVCGKKKASDVHHLCYGTANRQLSDDDQLTLELCRDCHDVIHRVGTAGHLSKMLGQALWERDYFQRKAEELLNLPLEQEVRGLYIGRYGRSEL